jgi:hypothetical protein
MNLQQYVDSINKRYLLGNATEHTFRGDLQQLLESLVPNIKATNEPKRQSCGAPDYILTKRDIPVGFIEAKDIGDKDLDGQKKTGNKEQFDRYRHSLDNLIFTDYINFHFYQDGEFVIKIAIGELTDRGIKPLPECFANFESLIKDFCSHVGHTIKSPKRLAEMMAGKARLLSDVIEKALTSDEENEANSTLKEQMEAFKVVLIHDIKPKEFADVYAQTIAYGLFAARLHDPTLPTFSRQEAAELIPKSNPFLRKLFGYIAGPDIDDRIKWIVDNLVEVFLHCNVEEILQNYGRSTRTEDPIIHFYETFLSEYDSKLRKARGVWYTPAPVVNFIVRAVDDILKTEFNLPSGLADNSKTKIKIKVPGNKGIDKVIDHEVHKVQILDPATGTGTFLAEVVKQVHKQFEGQEGIWSSYAENHLIPRLNGFELLMASYAMAHLKLDLLFKETGFVSTKNQRFKVYLTNSLEESHPDTGTLFANWLSTEANEANQIKRDTPVMCVIGNPPYSVSSTNKGQWIESLVQDYKKNLNERNIQPLSDDYIKFIRYGHFLLEKYGAGVLAFISNNSFIDGLIHRQMRKSLLNSFDKIYIINLHGSAKKNEKAPDGSKDENVFDIQQGVSINLFVKTGRKKTNDLGRVMHFDLYGKREYKYKYLWEASLSTINFNELENREPNYFFINKSTIGEVAYNKGFKIDEIFILYASGIKTQRDDASIKLTQFECDEIKRSFLELTNEQLKLKYGFKDVRDWTIDSARNDLNRNKIIENRIAYRPFDNRFMNYTGKTKGIQGYPRLEVMKHLIENNNICLLTCRQQSTFDFQHIFITSYVSDMCTISSQTKEGSYAFPLYLQNEISEGLLSQKQADRFPNLKQEIIDEICETLQFSFTIEKDNSENTFSPIDILDYIYAVLHSPSYREKYKEFLKIDFPRIPYPTDKESFWKLVELGSELRQVHLMESPALNKLITKYPVSGNNEITTLKYQAGKIFINDQQYFDLVPETSWNFYIGGYQPAQKWLKDRKGRILTFEDILHYQKIIVALSETERLMNKIDDLEFY